MKNKMVLNRKLPSLLLAIIMILSVCSVFTVSAADTNGYYKTVTSLDFESGLLPSGSMYVDATKTSEAKKDVDVAFDMSAAIAETEYPYLNFQYRLLEGTTLASGAMMAISLNGNTTYPAIQTINVPASYTAGEWISVTDLHFHGEALPAGSGNFLRISVYQGVEIEIGTIEVHKNENYGGAILANIDFANNGTFEEVNTGMQAAEDYGIYIDNTTAAHGSGYDSFWVEPLGMVNPKAPAGNYTITVDYYLLSLGTSHNTLNLRYARRLYGSNSMPESNPSGYWQAMEAKVGSWKTMTYTVTSTDDMGSLYFYVSDGVKGYLDNIKIIASDGTVLSDFAVTKADVGKSKNCASAAQLPADIVAAKTAPEEDTAMLIDVTSVANDGNSNKSFWFNELGMASYYNALTPGATYSVVFDVYPLQKPISTVFHYRTSNGSASSNAGWWGKDLEVGKWQTTSNTFTVNEAYGNHILFAYGGFKGYVDNLRLVDANGNEVAGTFTNFDDLSVPEKHAAYLTLTTDIPEKAVPDTVLLADLTSVADDGGSNKNFWFNELGMASYYNQLTEGAQYTITFDVYPLQKPTNQPNFFHYQTSNGSASSNAGWWGSNLETGKWQTTSNTFTVNNAYGNHILYIYGGFKGYIDNLRLVDSDGNDVYSTYTDFSGLSIPEKHAAYLTLTTDGPSKEAEEEGEDYTVRLSLGVTDYMSGRVFKIAPAMDQVVALNANTIGAGLVSGKQYRFSFDYNIFAPAAAGNSVSVRNVLSGADSDDHIASSEGAVSGRKEYVFTATGDNLAIEVCAGCEAIFDNILLEEFVNFPALGVMKRESTEEAGTVSALVYGMQLKVEDNKEYIYEETGAAVEVAEKGFLAILTDHLDGEFELDSAEENPFASVVKVTEPADSVNFEGEVHHVYTLAITDPEPERSITVRPFVVGTNGDVYYGDTVALSASDLADAEFDVWQGAAIAR